MNDREFLLEYIKELNRIIECLAKLNADEMMLGSIEEDEFYDPTPVIEKLSIHVLKASERILEYENIATK